MHSGIVPQAHILFERVGIVKAKNVLALVLVCQVAVQDRSLEVTDVKVARRLRG
jgi:hypothetical protein